MAETRRHPEWGVGSLTAGSHRADDLGTGPAPDVLDEGVLLDLARDLGQPAARRCAERYRTSLKRRIELLTVAALEVREHAVCETALDLAVSSATVGAVALAKAAWAVAHDVVQTRAVPQVDALERLMWLAHDTESALVRLSRTGTPDPGPYG
ncbi:hypothetical protein ACFQHV_05910 [Promicromonospora thailandica]|uniref:Uncharacterized protein n=1 Tax=Promicromonospora thailandica TaxID=765201 RepID=A0A9X2G0Y0_9MICO|nr:hypothetical protein [Promicromonospora thailandica]MCP2263353.1 hypothetical protein [Promicromonospora thailandica]BFF19496.1 hypothetical protein GCM10025730_30170 [Promicromonospora thailandica]